MMFKRFFDDGEVSEVIDMVNTKIDDSTTTKILDEYGPTFGKLYLHVFREGIIKGWFEYQIENNERIVRNLFDEGCDIDFISKITGLSIYEIKKII